MEKSYPADVKIIHYHCDTCGAVMQYRGVEMFSKFQHNCTGAKCETTKLLDRVYPFTVVDMLTPDPIKNETAD